MKIKTKLVLFYFLIFATTVASVFYFSETTILSGFEKIENDLVRRNIDRFKEIIAEEQSTLINTSFAWSTWNDTYNFIKNPTKKYLQDNYLNESFIDNKINGIIILDLKNNILFDKQYDLNTKQISDFDPMGIDLIKRVIDETANIKDSTSGVLYYNKKAHLYTINPILPNTNTSKHEKNGYMVFVRDLDIYMLTKFRRILKFNINENFLNDNDIYANDDILKEDNYIEAEVYIPANGNRLQLEYELGFNRDIYLYGQSVLKIFYITFFVMLFLIFFITYFFVNKIITNRILKISNELNDISNDNAEIVSVSDVEKDEIGVLAQNINSTLNRLKDDQQIIYNSSKLAALGEMAGSIAHEINNPLTVIQGHNQRIQKSLSNNDFNRESLILANIKIRENVDRIVKIIKSLKLASRGGDNDEIKIYRSKDILEEINNLFEFNLKQKEIRFDTNNFDLNIDLKINFVQILQVFINLLNNSVDAIKTKEEKWIKIYSIETFKSFQIYVQDSGDPIPEEIIEKIMQPFFTTKEIGSGTGLGLSIVEKIIKNHGGSFEFVRTEKHTTFKITLPLAQQEIVQKAS